MPFYATSKEEKSWLPLGPQEPDTCGVWYRRLSPSEDMELITLARDRGVIDSLKLTIEAAVIGIVGWRGYCDPVSGDDIPFPDSTQDRRELIIRMPLDYLGQIATAIRSPELDRVALLGNLNALPQSNGLLDAGTTQATVARSG